MKAINVFIIFLLLIPNKFLKSEVFNSDEILIQENGRVKPFDTFARNNLLAIFSKRSLKSSALPNSYSEKQMSASDWLFEISTKPYQAHNHRIFNIQNPELVRSMGLDWDDKHLFTAEEGRAGAIVSLLEILQLMKDSLIQLAQNEPNGPIYVKAAS